MCCGVLCCADCDGVGCYEENPQIIGRIPCIVLVPSRYRSGGCVGVCGPELNQSQFGGVQRFEALFVCHANSSCFTRVFAIVVLRYVYRWFVRELIGEAKLKSKRCFLAHQTDDVIIVQYKVDRQVPPCLCAASALFLIHYAMLFPTHSGVTMAVLLYRRDGAMLAWLLGCTLAAVVGKVLKLVIWQKRPDGSIVNDPGMPSSHALV